MPSGATKRAQPSPSRGPAAAVSRAVASVSPIVTMWRDGLTIIALDSREPDRAPTYLTFDQAQEARAIEVDEAPVDQAPDTCFEHRMNELPLAQAPHRRRLRARMRQQGRGGGEPGPLEAQHCIAALGEHGDGVFVAGATPEEAAMLRGPAESAGTQ